MKDRFLIETMIRAEVNGRICRVWRDPNQGELLDSEIKSRAICFMNEFGLLDESAAAFSIIRIAGVNSVEIVNRKTGDGTCIHKNWP